MLIQISSFFLASTTLFANAYLHLDTPQGNTPNNRILRRVTYTGTGTSYKQPSTPGSCGQVSPDSAVIAALGDAWMKYSYDTPYCNKSIHVTNTGVQGKGNTMTVTVTDTCLACDANQVAFSLGAWNQLTGSSTLGTVDLEWYFAEYGGFGNTSSVTSVTSNSGESSGGGAGVTSPNAPNGPGGGGSGGGAGVTSPDAPNGPGGGGSGGGSGVTSPNSPNSPTSTAQERFSTPSTWLGIVVFLVSCCA